MSMLWFALILLVLGVWVAHDGIAPRPADSKKRHTWRLVDQVRDWLAQADLPGVALWDLVVLSAVGCLAGGVAGYIAFGVPVTAALGSTDARTAVRLGAASLEYLSGIPEAAGDSLALYDAQRRGDMARWAMTEVSWLGTDPEALMSVARDLAGTGVTLVPTLARHELFSRWDDATIYERSDLALLPDSARVNWDIAGMMRREGWTVNHKRVYRMYRAEGLSLRRKSRSGGGRR